jgi:hypothetical protein
MLSSFYSSVNMAVDRARLLRFLSLFLLFVATILLFVASLSTPIIKTLSFLVATDTTLGVTSTAHVGLWGVCFATSRSAIRCSSTGLGLSGGAYKSLRASRPDALPVSLSGLPIASEIAEAVSGSIGFLLVLHPIGALS